MPFDIAGYDINGEEMYCFPFLSRQVNGLLEGTLTMMGGYSSTGKSTWWVTVIMALLNYDRKILIISNEENVKKFKIKFMVWLLGKRNRYFKLTKKKLMSGDLTEAINEGVRQGYAEGFLRKSVVRDPLDRINTGDNTPAIIYYDIVPGDKIEIIVAPKGAGSENMSHIKMLKPSDGLHGIKDFVLQVVKDAGSNPCPPIVVGVGVGGTFDKAALLAKKALLRATDERNPDPVWENLEAELLSEINALGIGPQGFGGKTTALCVNIEQYPCHIASLPVAVNINCHVTRHMKEVI